MHETKNNKTIANSLSETNVLPMAQRSVPGHASMHIYSNEKCARGYHRIIRKYFVCFSYTLFWRWIPSVLCSQFECNRSQWFALSFSARSFSLTERPRKQVLKGIRQVGCRIFQEGNSESGLLLLLPSLGREILMGLSLGNMLRLLIIHLLIVLSSLFGVTCVQA